MAKGLPRSRAHAAPQRSALVKQVVKLRAKQITVDGLSGVGFGTVVVGDFPKGNLLLLGVASNLKFDATGQAGVTNAWTGNYSLGSAPTADATLSGAEVDIIPSTALSAGGSDKIAPLGRAVLATPLMLNNTDDSLEINLNMIIADVSISQNGQIVTVDGEVYLAYVVLGDDSF